MCVCGGRGRDTSYRSMNECPRSNALCRNPTWPPDGTTVRNRFSLVPEANTSTGIPCDLAPGGQTTHMCGERHQLRANRVVVGVHTQEWYADGVDTGISGALIVVMDNVAETYHPAAVYPDLGRHTRSATNRISGRPALCQTVEP